jgi:hypothetical protein
VHRRALIAVLALGLSVPVGAGAQEIPLAPRFSASISVGTLGVTDLQVQGIRTDRLGDDGEVIGTGTLSRTVSGRGGRHLGGAVVIRLSPAWALRLGGGVGRLRLTHGFSGAAEWAAPAGEVPLAVDSDIGIVSLESAVRFLFPTARSLQPYLEVGMASERWSSGPELSAVAGTTDATRVGGYAAVGGDYPLARRLALSLRAATTVFRTPLSPVVAGTEIGRTDSLVLTAEAPAAGRYSDAAVELARTVRLDVGLSYRPGAPAAVPQDRSGPGESMPAPRP